MNNKTITNYLLNLERFKIEEHSIFVTINKQSGWNVEGASFDVTVSYKAGDSTVRYINPKIRVDYSSYSAEDILNQLRNTVLKEVQEQIETDNTFTEVQSKISKSKELEKLEPFINKEYYSVFKSSIEKEVPIVLSSKVLNRCTGKTSTLAYLAIEKDLPLVVFTSMQVKMLRNKFPSLKVSSSKRGSGISSDIILIDEADVDSLHESGRVGHNSSLIGVVKSK